MTGRRILYGYRDDLKLADRWWHRLFFVVGIAATLAVGVVVFMLESDQQKTAARKLEDKDNYLEFVKRNANLNTPIFLISTFLEGYSTSGYCVSKQDPNKFLSSYTSGADRSFCTKKEFVDDAVAEGVKLYSGRQPKITLISVDYGLVCIVSAQFPDCDLTTITSQESALQMACSSRKLAILQRLKSDPAVDNRASEPIRVASRLSWSPKTIARRFEAGSRDERLDDGAAGRGIRQNYTLERPRPG